MHDINLIFFVCFLILKNTMMNNIYFTSLVLEIKRSNLKIIYAQNKKEVEGGDLCTLGLF